MTTFLPCFLAIIIVLGLVYKYQNAILAPFFDTRTLEDYNKERAERYKEAH